MKIYRLLRLAVLTALAAGRPGRDKRAVPIDDSRDNLNEIINILKKHDVVPVLVPEARRSPESNSELAMETTKFKNLLKSLSVIHQIPYADAGAYIAGFNAAEQSRIFYDSVHMTPYGNSLLAGFLAGVVTNLDEYREKPAKDP